MLQENICISFFSANRDRHATSLLSAIFSFLVLLNKNPLV